MNVIICMDLWTVEFPLHSLNSEQLKVHKVHMLLYLHMFITLLASGYSLQLFVINMFVRNLFCLKSLSLFFQLPALFCLCLVYLHRLRPKCFILRFLNE